MGAEAGLGLSAGAGGGPGGGGTRGEEWLGVGRIMQGARVRSVE